MGLDRLLFAELIDAARAVHGRWCRGHCVEEVGMPATYLVPPTQTAENIQAIAANGKGQSWGRSASVEQFTHLTGRGQGVDVGEVSHLASTRKDCVGRGGGRTGHMRGLCPCHPVLL